MNTAYKEMDRRLENAQTAKANAKSEWGKNYWDIVIAHLLRVANRLN